ncbi:MAG: ABC transporter permease [Acidobacteria bacterium]|nr:MAG: ABC transporter permease [Acidobacteriota bacterium]GIK76378.1 MAG: ABC transporter permease [Actinomycetes bacterium]
MAEAISKTPEAGAPKRAPAGRPAGKRRRKLAGIFDPIEPRTYMIIALLSFAVLFFGWWVAAEIDLAKDIFLPSPADVWNRGVELAKDGTLWADVKVSFVRITIGFLISTAIALPIGIAIGTYRLAEAAIEPPVDFIRYMPAVAFLPLTIVWVGVDESQKWLIIFIGTFFQQVLLVMDNVKRVPREYVDISHTLGMRDHSVLRKVVLPAAAPAIWDTLRITLGWAWTWLVIAELVAASDGLGHRIIVAQRYFQTDTIFVGILVIGLLGLIMDQIMKYTGKRIFRWAE